MRAMIMYVYELIIVIDWLLLLFLLAGLANWKARSIIKFVNSFNVFI